MSDDLGTCPDRLRVLELLRHHGWNATSFQALEPGLLYFFHGDDGCVAYVETADAWVAAGAPIASEPLRAHERAAPPRCGRGT